MYLFPYYTSLPSSSLFPIIRKFVLPLTAVLLRPPLSSINLTKLSLEIESKIPVRTKLSPFNVSDGTFSIPLY